MKPPVIILATHQDSLAYYAAAFVNGVLVFAEKVRHDEMAGYWRAELVAQRVAGGIKNRVHYITVLPEDAEKVVRLHDWSDVAARLQQEVMSK